MQRTASLSPFTVDWSRVPHGTLGHYNFIRIAPFGLFPLTPLWGVPLNEQWSVMAVWGKEHLMVVSRYSQNGSLRHVRQKTVRLMYFEFVRGLLSSLCWLYNTAGTSSALFPTDGFNVIRNIVQYFSLLILLDVLVFIVYTVYFFIFYFSLPNFVIFYSILADLTY